MSNTATKKYLHLISFTCQFHEKTFYTLYVTTKPKFNKSLAVNSLRNGSVWGKSGGKERTPQIVELAKKYIINDAFSIKSKEVDIDTIRPTIAEFNKKYSKERDNFITYLG